MNSMRFRRPHTSAGTTNREREWDRERGRKGEFEDGVPRAMLWSSSERTLPLHGDSKALAAGMAATAGDSFNPGGGGRASESDTAQGAPSSRFTTFSADPASNSALSPPRTRATTGTHGASDGRRNERERRAVGGEGVFRDGDADADGLFWEASGGRAKVRGQEQSADIGNDIPASSSRRTLEDGRSSDASHFRALGSPPAPAPFGQAHQAPPPSLGLSSIRQYWYQAHSGASSNSSSTATATAEVPKTPRSAGAGRTRSRSRPSTASGILEGRFFRDRMAPSSSSDHRHHGRGVSPPSRFPLPVSVCCIP